MLGVPHDELGEEVGAAVAVKNGEERRGRGAAGLRQGAGRRLQVPAADLVHRRAAQGADGQDPQARDRAAGLTAVRAAALLAAAAAAAPTQAGAPWPTMRHDTANTGRSPIAARWHGDRPWSFATGRGIFSTAGHRRRRHGLHRLGRRRLLRAGPRRPRALAGAHGRHHRRRRGDLALRRAPAHRAADLRLGRRAPLPRAHGPRRRCRARGGSCGRSARAAGPRRGSSSTGGRATSAWRRTGRSWPATPAGRPTR